MVQKWNFAIQQELPGPDGAWKLAIRATTRRTSCCSPTSTPVRTLRPRIRNINCNSLRPYPDIGSISGTASFGFGNYEALTAKLEKQLSQGLQFITSYTYGHALANSGTTLSGSQRFVDQGSGQLRHVSYSSAAWDIRHNFTTGFTYRYSVRPGNDSTAAT